MNMSDTERLPDFETLALSGVAPNVIRELSGIYPTFASAFKELISNAYDADATQVRIVLAPDLSTITIEDNGRGMTLFEFQDDYIRIGGSVHRRDDADLTPGGRRPIGRKGIGFLAVARYCRSVEIQSQADRKVTCCKDVVLKPRADSVGFRTVPLLQGPCARTVDSLTTVQKVRCGTTELTPAEYRREGGRLELTAEAGRKHEGRNLSLQYTVDFSLVEMEASIDYEYLLDLGDEHNLDRVQDFCRVRIGPVADTTDASPSMRPGASFTRVTMYLREFAQQELREPKRLGWVRNVASASGQERFLWHLSRSVPTSYVLSSEDLNRCGLELLAEPVSPTPFTIRVTDATGETREFRRPLLGEMTETDSGAFEDLLLVKNSVHLESDELEAQGYVMGLSQPVFPAELRGIAIRVRGVEIGGPNFLGVEDDLPVKYRPFLNQVLGEIIVTKGLDAVSAIVPGREGFYVENAAFQVLRKHLVGDGVVEFGVLGQVLDQIWKRSRVGSSAERIVQEAKRRRGAFLDVAQAITMLSVNSRYGRELRRLFSRSDIVANGLGRIPEHKIGLPTTIGDYTVELSELSEDDLQVDMERKVVRLDRDTEMWSQPLYILNRDFEISLRSGKPNDPVCEVDFATDTIYLNWMHPTRGKMGDALFVKSALFWRIAYLAANGDVDLMMNLAHRLLSLSA
jgi:hypothetical protein